MVRPCEENERGARSEKNVRCGHTREKKKRTAKPTMERCMKERHDRSGSETQDHQLYRRPGQMTGQAREEEDGSGGAERMPMDE